MRRALKTRGEGSTRCLAIGGPTFRGGRNRNGRGYIEHWRLFGRNDWLYALEGVTKWSSYHEGAELPLTGLFKFGRFFKVRLKFLKETLEIV